MVTADINHERRLSSGVDSEDDEKNNRLLQNRLDRLYLDRSHYNPSVSHRTYPSFRSQSPSGSRDMYMPTNTVPVYRHGRKFYVSIEEYERIRAEERRHRRTQMQKAQNLPVPKSHPTNSRSLSTSYYNPVQRSISNPHEYRQGVSRSVQMPTNSTIQNENRQTSTRQSRATLRYNDGRDESTLIVPTLPIRLPTTATRSNSSDKVLDLHRNPQLIQESYNGYISDDNSVKRSLSAEAVQEQIPIRRQVPASVYDYDRSNVSTYPQTFTDQTYGQSNSSKLTNYLNQIPSATLDSSRKPFVSDTTSAGSLFQINPHESENVYNVRSSFNRQNDNFSTTKSSPIYNRNQYYTRDTIIGSFSDDNSASPPPPIQRRNTDRTRYRRAELIVETDDDYESHNRVFPRSTGRSQSNDRLTEKKRVRFADMEGLTLEVPSDREQQQQRSTDYRLYSRPAQVDRSTDLWRGAQPLPNSFYQMNSRAGNVNESKLATDV